MHPGTRQLLLEYRLGFEPYYYSSIYRGGAISDLPPREQISNINVPCLIVSQPDDANHPVKMAQELNNLIKGSEMFIVTDYDSYQKLQMKVCDFINKLT
jgi:pimeloyl-ACP methyl ester carboxylesterase